MPRCLAQANSCLSTFAVLCCLLLGNVHAADNSERFNALIIYGSGGIANWDQEFNASLRDELGPELGQYFASEILPLIGATAEEREQFARSLILKYSNRDIGLVVPVLSEANDFVTEWAQLFAPEAAILRVLPSDDYLTRPGSFPNPEIILASAIREAAQQTFALLPAMLPDLDRIYVIGGAGAGDLAYMRRYQSILADIDPPYEFEFLSGYPADELIEVLSQVPANSAVMTTTYDVDREGRPMRALILTRRMTDELSLPVIALANPQIAAGAIGGNVTTAGGYARRARELIDGIYAGQYPSGPVTPENEYIFNGEQLDRFGVNRSILPVNSTFLNDPPDLWRDYAHWIALGIGVILVQGFLIGLLLINRQRRRQMETQLAQAHKMEALGTLAGGIAHDFNNILMTIMANTELLELGAKKDSEERQRLGKILSASERAKSLVAQILMFSRQSTKAQYKPLNLRHFIDDSMEQLAAMLPASCHLSVSGSSKLPSVTADVAQLYQVISNLCVNARYAMESKGEIKLSVEQLQVNEALPGYRQQIPPGNYVLLKVMDSGSGIRPEDMEHIFEPFFTTKPRGEGTGLGLSLVYQIIKNHQGFIAIESEVDVGTTVLVYLPATADTAMRAEPADSRKILKGNKEHLLLVDDDELVLDANREMLVRLGYQVTPYSSSIEALKSFQRDPDAFQLLFTDLSMPGMDGVRLISKVREVKPALPVVLCTGYLDALETADLEGLHVLKKPTSLADISAVIKQALQTA